MKLESVCSTLTVVAAPGETLAEVASRMRFNDVGAVPIVRGRYVVGILTERDLARAIADGVDSRHATAEQYMTPDPAVVGPETDLAEAAHLMAEAGIRHLPVVEDGKLFGLASIRDILFELTLGGLSAQGLPANGNSQL